MEGIVEALIKLSPNALPHYLDMTWQKHNVLVDSFERRLGDLVSYLGDANESTLIGDWYPSAIRAAIWTRGAKTICLILEQHNRHRARANLLWCVTDDEIERLREANQSRRKRVSSLSEYRKHFDAEFTKLVKRAPAMSFTRRTLIDDLFALGPEAAIKLVAEKLGDGDGEFRCEAGELMLRMEGQHGLRLVLPLFNDPLDWVRWNVLKSIARYGDDSVIEPLIGKLKTDTDPGVRGNAAFALGHIGSPAAIPALIAALENDQEEDQLGHSPSSISATALDNILGTNQTRIKMEDGFCKMAPWPPDLDELKRKAWELYAEWKSSQAR